VELFDVEVDIEEMNNKLDYESEVVALLREELMRWLAEPRQPFERAE